MKRKYLYILSSLLVLASCRKVDEYQDSVDIQNLKASYTISDTIKINVAPSSNIKGLQWKLNDELIGTNDTLNVQLGAYGKYTLSVSGTMDNKEFNKSIPLEIKPYIAAGANVSDLYATKLYEFTPAPGQFINELSTLKSATSILGNEKGLLSLGAWGGYMVLGFNKRVNNVSGKADLEVKGNPLPTWAEPGVIWVMKDENNNGLPDDTWYEIAGSESGKDGEIKNYEVTYYRPSQIKSAEDIRWIDNKGNSGVVKANTFHRQSYFPSWIRGNQYTIKGTLLPNSNLNKTNPQMITNMSFEYGYADNKTDANGGDLIDIEDAINAQGNKVSISGIDFIKIQTGMMADAGWLGEASTEISFVKNLNPNTP